MTGQPSVHVVEPSLDRQRLLLWSPAKRLALELVHSRCVYASTAAVSLMIEDVGAYGVCYQHLQRVDNILELVVSTAILPSLFKDTECFINRFPVRFYSP